MTLVRAEVGGVTVNEVGGVMVGGVGRVISFGDRQTGVQPGGRYITP